MEKVCKKCNVPKSLDMFSVQRGMTDGLRAYCKTCNSLLYKEYCLANPLKVKDAYYRKMYGITLEQYDAMFTLQNGACAICLQPETAKGKCLAVDHSAITKQVRGLLCHKCNSGLGQFNHEPELLMAGAKYLERFMNDT